MSERDDYVDDDQPPTRLPAVLSRRRWPWLALLVGVNLAGGAAWYATRPAGGSVGNLRYDPLEDEPKARPVLDRAGLEAEQELAAQGITPEFGYCHSYWPVKKRILMEKYGITWRTPAEMNPNVAFD
jgi:hypothetical protein